MKPDEAPANGKLNDDLSLWHGNHTWQKNQKRRRELARLRALPQWASDDSVEAYEARGGGITRCDAGIVPEIFDYESCIIGSDEWGFTRKLTHSSDTFFLNPDQWISTPPTASQREYDRRVALPGAVAPSKWSRPDGEPLTNVWLGYPEPRPIKREWSWSRTPISPGPPDARAGCSAHRPRSAHAWVVDRQVIVVGTLPVPGQVLPPRYGRTRNGQLIILHRCLAGSSRCSRWSFRELPPWFEGQDKWVWSDDWTTHPRLAALNHGAAQKLLELEQARADHHSWRARCGAEAPLSEPPVEPKPKRRPKPFGGTSKLTREQRYKRNTS